MALSFEHEVTVRYRDLDTYGHVNNVVYGTYCEQARVAYLAEVLPVDSPDEFSIVLANLEMDFRSSVTDVGTVDVAVGVTRLGDSSFTMAYEIAQDGRLAVQAETTQVYVDQQTGETASLPVAWRERIAEYEGFDA